MAVRRGWAGMTEEEVDGCFGLEVWFQGVEGGGEGVGSGKWRERDKGLGLDCDWEGEEGGVREEVGES